MKPSMKRISQLVVLIIFICLLFGCSKDDSDDAPVATELTGEEIPSLVATVPSPPDHPTIYTGDTVTFEGSVSGGTAPYTYVWDFADVVEDSSVEDPGDVTFNTAGKYLIIFKVTDANENVKTVAREVTVYEDLFPSVTIDSPSENLSILQGTTVRFYSTVSGGNPPVTCLWDFKGGADNVSLVDPGPILFDVPGIFNVTLTATDGNGDVATESVRVLVGEYNPSENTKPVATIDSPSSNVTINVGEGVIFMGSVVGGNSPLTYEWSFNGGNPGSSTQEDPGLVVYNTPGSYNTSFSVRDRENDWSRDSVIVTVLPDVLPTAAINSPASGSTIIAGQFLTFLGSVQGGNAPFSYNWNFGGGAADTNEKDPGNVIFDAAGNYTVTLTVTDGDGDVDDTSVDITIEEDLLPTAVIDRPADTVRIALGNYVNFQGTATGGNDRITYLWDFGDEDINADVPLAYRTSEDPRNVIFDKMGTFTVTFRVSDSDGDVVSDTVVVEVVEDVDPIAEIESPADNITINNGQAVYFRGLVVEGNSPFYYSWDLDDDGLSESSVLEPGEIKFYNPGTYTIRFKVYDSDGDVDEDSVVVTVNSVPIPVPDVSGMSIYEARRVIEESGLIPGAVYCEHDDIIPPLGVINQSPGSGISVRAGSSVQFTISLGVVDASAQWREKGSVVNEGTNNYGVRFADHDYPAEVGTLVTGYTEQVLDVADPVYITTWEGPFSVVPPITLENADVLEEEYSVGISATGNISGAGTLTYTKFVIQSGTYAGFWLITGTYELDGYTGNLYGNGTTNTMAWSGLLEGELNGLYLHNGDQGMLYLTSINGIQTSGSITCQWDDPVNNYSLTYPDIELLIQDGITWSGTGTGLYTGYYEHAGVNMFIPMYRSGQYIGTSISDDELKAYAVLVQSDDLYATIVSPSGDVTIDQGQSLDFRSWVTGHNWPYTFEWVFEGYEGIDSDQKNPGMIEFNNPGTYPVRFRVIDNQGNEYSESVVVTVNYVDTEPVAAIMNPSGDIAILEGNSITFEGVVVGGNAPFEYEWDFNGDGVADAFGLSSESYTFETADTYHVNFKVTDNDGDENTASITVTVAAMQPVPDVVGVSLSDAISAINAQGLMIGLVYVNYDADVPSGLVAGQVPQAGNMVEPGTSVDLTVSIGPADPNSFWMHRGLTTGSFPTPVNTTVSIIDAQHQDPFSQGSVWDATAEYLPSLVAGDNHASWSGSFSAVPPVEMMFADVNVRQTIGSTGTVTGDTSTGVISGDITATMITYTIASGEYTGHRYSNIAWELGDYTGNMYSVGNSASGDFVGGGTSGEFWGRLDGEIRGTYRTIGTDQALIDITSIAGVQASGTLSITWSGTNYHEISSSHSNVPLYVQKGVSWSGQGSGCVTGDLIHSGTKVYLPGFNVGQYLGIWFYYETDPNSYDQSGYIYSYLDRNTQFTTTVPCVEGLSLLGAEEIINSKGLSVEQPVEYISSVYPSGHVISQNPPAGGTAAQGSTVNLTVSQ